MTKAELRVELAKAQNDADEKAKAARLAHAAHEAARKKVKELANSLRAAEKAPEASKK